MRGLNVARRRLEAPFEELDVLGLYLLHLVAFDEQRPIVGEELDGREQRELHTVESEARKRAKVVEQGVRVRRAERVTRGEHTWRDAHARAAEKRVAVRLVAIGHSQQLEEKKCKVKQRLTKIQLGAQNGANGLRLFRRRRT